jgi:hypothetical protein
VNKPVEIASILTRWGEDHPRCNRDFKRRMAMAQMLEKLGLKKLAFRLRCCARGSNPHGKYPCNVTWCCELCAFVAACHHKRVIELRVEAVRCADPQARFFLMTIATPGMKAARKQVKLLREVLRRIWRKRRGVLSCVGGMVVVLEPAREADPRLWRIHFHVIVYVHGSARADWNAQVRRWKRRWERMPPSIRRRTKRRFPLSAVALTNAAVKLLRVAAKKAGVPDRLLLQAGLVHTKPFDPHKAEEWDTKFCASDTDSLGWHAGNIVRYATSREKASAQRMSNKDWVNLQVARIGCTVSCCGALRWASPSKAQIAQRRAVDMAEAELRDGMRRVKRKKPVSTMTNRQANQAKHK